MGARAAARVGAGLTSIAVPEIALPIYATTLTSIMVKPLLAPGDFDALLNDVRVTGFLIGPAPAWVRRHVRNARHPGNPSGYSHRRGCHFFFQRRTAGVDEGDQRSVRHDAA